MLKLRSEYPCRRRPNARITYCLHIMTHFKRQEEVLITQCCKEEYFKALFQGYVQHSLKWVARGDATSFGFASTGQGQSLCTLSRSLLQRVWPSLGAVEESGGDAIPVHAVKRSRAHEDCFSRSISPRRLKRIKYQCVDKSQW